MGTEAGTYESLLPLTLPPGWYALEFGTGKFGASSAPSLRDLSMPKHGVDLDPTQLATVALQLGHPSLTPRFSLQSTPVRFFATASVVIPTVTTWGLMIMTLLLLIGAKVEFNRRRTAQA